MSRLTAMIRDSSPRAAAWRDVFGGDTVPILSPLPIKASGPDGDAEFYRLDVAALDTAQRGRLVSHLCRRFKLQHIDVEHLIDDPNHGVPILADDVVVPLDLRLFT